MSKKIKLLIFLAFLVIFYFEYSVTIAWDSAHYMQYVNIFEGTVSSNNWDVVRGPVFPLIIWFGNIIFGKTAQGLLMMTFSFYILMLAFSYKMLKEFFYNCNFSNKTKEVLIFIIMLLIIVNPIIYGFYHCLLTEFIAITLSVCSCYLGLKWLNVDYYTDKFKYIIFSSIFLILIIFSWFLKQPYVSTTLFVLLVSYFISVFRNKKLWNFIIRTITVISCIAFLIISINIWNMILKSIGADPDADRNPTVTLGNQILNGTGYIEIKSSDDIYTLDYIDNSKLSKSEKSRAKKLIDERKYIIIDFKSNKKVIKSKLFESDSIAISAIDAGEVLLSEFLSNPLRLSQAYIDNYLSVIDLYEISTDNGVVSKSSKNINLISSKEISTLAFRPYNYNMDNIFYVLPEMYTRVENYQQNNMSFVGLNYYMQKTGVLFVILFKLLFLLLPLALLYSIVFRIKNKIIQEDNMNIVIILLGYSLLHVLLHVFLGAIIDRYIVPALLTTFLGIIFLLINTFIIFMSNRKKWLKR